jgi:hypothetical protein
MSVPADIRKVVTVEADSYSWRQNSRIKADAAKAVTELRGIYTRDVVDEHAHRRRWKIQALSALQSWRRQYRDISEFAAIFEAIDALAAREDVAS